MAPVHAHIRSCEPIHTVVSVDTYRDIGRKVRSHVLFSSEEMLLFFGENAHFFRRKPTFCPNKIVILSFLGVKRLFSFPFLSKHELPGDKRKRSRHSGDYLLFSKKRQVKAHLNNKPRSIDKNSSNERPPEPTTNAL